jgi:hypothetical protein
MMKIKPITLLVLLAICLNKLVAHELVIVADTNSNIFELGEVPVFLDGVPIYVSYDGYAELGRFLVTDLSKMSVTRVSQHFYWDPRSWGEPSTL